MNTQKIRIMEEGKKLIVDLYGPDIAKAKERIEMLFENYDEADSLLDQWLLKIAYSRLSLVYVLAAVTVPFALGAYLF